MDHETIRIARESLLLSSAPEVMADALLDGAIPLTLARAKTIFSQGDAADAIFIVIEGWVKLYRVTQSGTEAVVGVFTRRHSFGEAVALHGGVYPVFAEAVTDCKLVRIDARAFLGLLQDNPGVAIAMLTATYAHLHGMVAQIEQLKAHTGPQRLAEFLLDLTNCQVGACAVKLPYDKVLIAGRLGMKPESLSRAFTRLREHGVKISRNAARIDNIETLRNYAEADRAASWHQG